MAYTYYKILYKVDSRGGVTMSLPEGLQNPRAGTELRLDQANAVDDAHCRANPRN